MYESEITYFLHFNECELAKKSTTKHLRRRAGGGASLWSRSRSNSLPVEIAGGGGSRADLSSVHGLGLGRLTTWTAVVPIRLGGD